MVNLYSFIMYYNTVYRQFLDNEYHDFQDITKKKINIEIRHTNKDSLKIKL